MDAVLAAYERPGVVDGRASELWKESSWRSLHQVHAAVGIVADHSTGMCLPCGPYLRWPPGRNYIRPPPPLLSGQKAFLRGDGGGVCFQAPAAGIL